MEEVRGAEKGLLLRRIAAAFAVCVALVLGAGAAYAWADPVTGGEGDGSGAVSAAENVGDKLEGDDAYISILTAEIVFDGSAPFDDDNSAGNDSNANNKIVRSFDTVGYELEFQTMVRDDAPYDQYKSGTLCFEFLLPGDSSQVMFDTEDAMTWLGAKGAEYEILEDVQHNGTTYQVLRGTVPLETAEGATPVIGGSSQTLTVDARVLAMKQDDTFTPTFTLWLEGNDVGSGWESEGQTTALVTDSAQKCGTHDEQEFKTVRMAEVEDGAVTVTSTPRFNVELRNAWPQYQYVDTFDFSTGKVEPMTQTPRPSAGASSRISRTAAQILAFVGMHEGEPCSKARIAEAVGCNVKTADRLMAGLRADGLLVVEPRWSENGGQLANSYRLPRRADGES